MRLITGKSQNSSKQIKFCVEKQMWYFGNFKKWSFMHCSCSNIVPDQAKTELCVGFLILRIWRIDIHVQFFALGVCNMLRVCNKWDEAMRSLLQDHVQDPKNIIICRTWNAYPCNGACMYVTDSFLKAISIMISLLLPFGRVKKAR